GGPDRGLVLARIRPPGPHDVARRARLRVREHAPRHAPQVRLTAPVPAENLEEGTMTAEIGASATGALPGPGAPASAGAVRATAAGTGAPARNAAALLRRYRALALAGDLTSGVVAA